MASDKFSHEEDLYNPGHRACPGCGAALACKYVAEASGENTIMAMPTGCMEVTSTPYPESAWGISWIHNIFENSAAVSAGIETAYKSFENRGKGGYMDYDDVNFVVLAGDGATFDIGIRSLSGMMERGHDVLYICYDNEAYMNCLPGSSLILTGSGLRRIEEIKTGDEVYVFDQEKEKPVLKECTHILNDGVREIFELSTLHHNIKATPNHPFLTLKRGGRGGKSELQWKKLVDLNPGDEVVVLKKLNPGSVHEFDFKPVTKDDRKVNRLNEIEIPQKSSSELMKYLGLYVGDGWTRPEKGEVGFALPEDTIAREVLKEIHKELFGGGTREDDLYIYSNSVNIARFIDSLGFGPQATTKKVPDWIFTLPMEQREAFVEGLILSDGYKTGNSYRYVSSSFELLRTLRLLLQTMNYRVGRIHRQKKKKGTKVVDRKLREDSEYGYICFSRKKGWNLEKYPNQYKYQNFLIENDWFEMEEVKEIKPAGKEPVIDLRVEDQHNFIADGFVVHNTGIQRSGSTPLGASTTTSPAGKESFGEDIHKKDMPAIAVAHGCKYVATANVAYPEDLKNKIKKALEVDGPKYLQVYAPCPRGWRSEAESSIEIARLAVQTALHPLFEMEDGEVTNVMKIRDRKPVEEFLKTQGRFKHLFKKEDGEKIIQEIQKIADKNAEKLDLEK